MLQAGLRYRHVAVAESQVHANVGVKAFVPSDLADILLLASGQVDGLSHELLEVCQLGLEGLQQEQLVSGIVTSSPEPVLILQLCCCVAVARDGCRHVGSIVCCCCPAESCCDSCGSAVLWHWLQ